MPESPTFDPSSPYELIVDFDPSQPFELIADAPAGREDYQPPPLTQAPAPTFGEGPEDMSARIPFVSQPVIPEGVPTQVTPDQLEQLYQSGELRRPPDWDAVRKRIALQEEGAGLRGEAAGLATLEKAATVAQEPLISADIAEQALRLGVPSLARAPGVQRSVAEAAAGLTSPVNIGMAAVGGGAAAIPKLGAAVARGIAGGFAADMASHMPELGTAAGEASVTGTPEEQQRAYTDLGLTALMGGLAGTGAVMPARPAIPPRIVEAIAKADQVGLTKSAQAVADTVRREPISDRPQQLEKPIEKGVPTDAIREPTATEGVLRQERPEVELQGVREPQVEAAIPREPARAQGGEEGKVLLRDVARQKEIEAQQAEIVGAQGRINAEADPQMRALRQEAQALRLKYGNKPSDTPAAKLFRIAEMPREELARTGTIPVEELATQAGPGALPELTRLRDATKAQELAAKEKLSAEAPESIYEYQDLSKRVQLFNEAIKQIEGRPNAKPIIQEQKAAGQTQPEVARAGEQAARSPDVLPTERIPEVQSGAAPAAPIAPEAVSTGPARGGIGGERPVGVAEATAKPALASAEAKLSQVVNQTIEQSSPTRLGVSPAATMRPMDVVLGAPDLRSLSPAVEARWQQAVKGTEGIIEKVKQNADAAWKSVTREYADLPPREFPREIDTLRRLRASPNAAARTTVDVLKGITHNMGPKQYGVFNRVALLEDLVKDVEAGKYATGNDLPFGYKDAGELTADLNKFRSVAESTPQIKAALERRQEFMDSMRSTLVERGFLPESILQDPRYFHHQVLMYMAERNAPAGSRSFRDWFSGWQKKRTGSSQDYNRQYVEAEAEVLADAFKKFTNQDLQGEMQGYADMAPQLKELHGAEWRQHLPKGYTTWQPKHGNAFYPVHTVAERIMDRYLSGLGEILPAEFKEALAVGGRRQEWVIPKELAKVLDNIAPRPDTWINRIAAAGISGWKKYILLNPLRAAKYNLNNLSGDLDFLFAAQPKIFKEFKSSASDMWGFHVKGKSAAGDIKEAMQDGVIGSGWRASELPDIARSDYFNWLTGEKPKLVDRYWDWIGKRNDAREDTGRLASYRFAKKEWDAGRPFYGASVPADVNALATPRLKAAKVAREILIDYGRGTEFSNFTRQKLVPFFKWMEGNFVRYQQLIKNLPEQEGAGPRVAGATAKKAATLAARLGAAYGIVNLWNHLFFPDEEEELGEGRNQLHLILGRDDQGNVQTIRFQGALSDLLGWVGMENLPQDVEDLATGRADVGDKMQDAYEAGISRAVNASQPFAKTAAEIGLGRSFYPNALEPRPVRDKAEHAAGLFSLKPVYQWLAGKPHKPLRQELANLIAYTTDPGEAAYNATRHMAGEWLEDQGEERANVIPGQRSNALYYYKQALRYKDQATAQKFLDEYNRLGGNREGLTQSIKASSPLSMLGNKRAEFLNSLSPQEQEAVKRAEEWYRRVYAP